RTPAGPSRRSAGIPRGAGPGPVPPIGSPATRAARSPPRRSATSSRRGLRFGRRAAPALLDDELERDLLRGPPTTPGRDDGDDPGRSPGHRRSWRPRQDSNLRTRLRRPMLYPLSYEGGERQRSVRDGALRTGGGTPVGPLAGARDRPGAGFGCPGAPRYDRAT